MTKTRMTPEEARLLIRDAIAAGLPAPKFPDRLSRAEAAQAENIARSSNWWRDAQSNSKNSKYLRLMIDAMQYFRAEHPATADGDAAPWPRAAFVPPESGADPFRGAPREAALAYLRYAEAHPEYFAAMRDPQHAQHHALLAQTRALRQIAATPDPAETGGSQEAATAAGPRADTARAVAIYELQRDTAYLDKHHPAHAEAVARMAALYEAAAPAAAAPASVTPPVTAPASPGSVIPQSGAAGKARETIARLQADEAYRRADHPEHAARVAEMAGAYQAAAAAPATGDENAAR